MNNKEVDEFYGKKVQFCLFLLKKKQSSEDGSKFEYLQFTETS